MDVEARVRRGAAWAATDDGARWAFWLIMAGSLVVLYVVGRTQWFIRDDWAFTFTREKVHQASGLDAMLFEAQDGHWMTFPILLWRATYGLFGTGSYWPYLIPAMICHLLTVVVIRQLSLRAGVTAWTATILAGILAVFGSGWENLLFAVQITYNLSLLAFLVQILLIDHDGPPDWRDWCAAAAGLVAVASSGFGPFFIFGTLLFMAMRRRWLAALITAGPMVVASAWWWLVWGSDPAGDKVRSGYTNVPAYVNRGLTAVFQGLTSTGSLVGIAMIATLAILLWRNRDPIAHDLMLSLGATAVVTFIGLGIERGGFGVETAANSRYTYIGAVLVIPAFGVAVDQLARIGAPALWAVRLLLIGAMAMNIGSLRTNGSEWANRSAGERNLLELIAASPALATTNPAVSPLAFSPDVRISDIPTLVADGAIHPHPASTPAEQALVDAALSQPPPP